jgi:hypothetical protein
MLEQDRARRLAAAETKFRAAQESVRFCSIDIWRDRWHRWVFIHRNRVVLVFNPVSQVYSLVASVAALNPPVASYACRCSPEQAVSAACRVAESVLSQGNEASHGS